MFRAEQMVDLRARRVQTRVNGVPEAEIDRIYPILDENARAPAQAQFAADLMRRSRPHESDRDRRARATERMVRLHNNIVDGMPPIVPASTPSSTPPPSLTIFRTRLGEPGTTCPICLESAEDTEKTSQASSLSLRLDLHDVSISVLENDADVNSRAIRLSIKQLFLSQQVSVCVSVKMAYTANPVAGHPGFEHRSSRDVADPYGQGSRDCPVPG